MNRATDPAAPKSMGPAQRAFLRALRVTLWLAMALPAVGLSQNSGTNGPYTTSPHGFPQSGSSPIGSEDGSFPVQSEKRLHQINVERQKALVANTNRLLALVTELRDEIAKSNPGDLTPEQLRKVAEIEKLAHNIKESMSMPFRSPGMNIDSPPFLGPMR